MRRCGLCGSPGARDASRPGEVKRGESRYTAVYPVVRLPDETRRDLVALSREIHADPELAYHEERAAARIALLLRRHGHDVELRIGGLATAFRARVGPPGEGIVLLAEYDALKGVGHGCGHNLIAITNLGAFLLAAADAKRLDVPIEIIGTPAEEDGGGKVDMLNAGAFASVGFVLSTHPSAQCEWGVS